MENNLVFLSNIAAALRNPVWLVRGQVHFVEPDIVGVSFLIQVHLKCCIDFLKRPVLFVRIIRVHVIGLIAYLQANVVDLISYTLHGPYQMNPSLRREGCARNRSWDPAGIWSIVPNVPLAGRIEVTFRTPHPALPAKSLVQIKLKSLRYVWIINVKIQVIHEMTDVVPTRDRVEVKDIAVAGAPRRIRCDAELRGITVHRRGGDILSDAKGGVAETRSANLPVAAGAGRECRAA